MSKGEGGSGKDQGETKKSGSTSSGDEKSTENESKGQKGGAFSSGIEQAREEALGYASRSDDELSLEDSGGLSKASVEERTSQDSDSVSTDSDVAAAVPTEPARRQGNREASRPGAFNVPGTGGANNRDILDGNDLPDLESSQEPVNTQLGGAKFQRAVSIDSDDSFPSLSDEEIEKYDKQFEEEKSNLPEATKVIDAEVKEKPKKEIKQEDATKNTEVIDASSVKKISKKEMKKDKSPKAEAVDDKPKEKPSGKKPKSPFKGVKKAFKKLGGCFGKKEPEDIDPLQGPDEKVLDTKVSNAPAPPSEDERSKTQSNQEQADVPPIESVARMPSIGSDASDSLSELGDRDDFSVTSNDERKPPAKKKNDYKAAASQAAAILNEGGDNVDADDLLKAAAKADKEMASKGSVQVNQNEEKVASNADEKPSAKAIKAAEESKGQKAKPALSDEQIKQREKAAYKESAADQAAEVAMYADDDDMSVGSEVSSDDAGLNARENAEKAKAIKGREQKASPADKSAEKESKFSAKASTKDMKNKGDASLGEISASSTHSKGSRSNESTQGRGA